MSLSKRLFLAFSTLVLFSVERIHACPSTYLYASAVATLVGVVCVWHFRSMYPLVDQVVERVVRKSITASLESVLQKQFPMRKIHVS